MGITKKYLDQLTYSVIGCAIEVHKQIGPGLLESIYEKCLAKEFTINGINFKTQQRIPLEYKGLTLSADLRYDFLVEESMIVELKAMDGILPIHEAVLLTYMKLLDIPKGIIINFNCTNIFKYGQKTMVNDYYRLLPES